MNNDTEFHNNGFDGSVEMDASTGSTRPTRTSRIASTTASAMPTSTITPDMMAVAHKIRDRALVLEEERRRVRSTEPILADLHERNFREQAINNRRRKHMLERVNERNAVELEIFGVRDAISDHQNNAKATDKETTASEERLRILLENRHHETVTFYGPNLARMETYANALETVVESKERDFEQRHLRLEGIRTELANSKAEETRIRRETKNVRETMARDEKDGNQNATRKQEDGEMTALSKRVRETIEQVCLFVRYEYQLRVWYACWKCSFCCYVPFSNCCCSCDNNLYSSPSFFVMVVPCRIYSFIRNSCFALLFVLRNQSFDYFSFFSSTEIRPPKETQTSTNGVQSGQRGDALVGRKTHRNDR